MDLDKGLQNEIDDLVELGQTGVHTVTRSQAFKDTGWEDCLCHRRLFWRFPYPWR